MSSKWRGKVLAGHGVSTHEYARCVLPCRTVRDRLLLIEHACKDLQLRGLADVAPESWTAADKTLCEREEILDKVIEGETRAQA